MVTKLMELSAELESIMAEKAGLSTQSELESKMAVVRDGIWFSP